MSNNFYDEGVLRQTAINLFHGWGYNFYRLENQLRADDQLVRSKAAWLLGQARASVQAAESAYRREFFGAPTRERPFPDAAVTASAQKLERLAAAMGTLGGRMDAQPVPENDRLTQRFRQEAATLKSLIASDELLVGQCSVLQGLLDARGGVWMLENLAQLEDGLAAIQKTLHERAALLQ